MCYPKVCYFGIRIVLSLRTIKKKQTQIPLPSFPPKGRAYVSLCGGVPHPSHIPEEQAFPLSGDGLIALRLICIKKPYQSDSYLPLVSPIYLPSHNLLFLEVHNPLSFQIL